MDSESSLTIMHVLEPGGGGTMRHVLDLASEQARRGQQVHIVYSPLRLEPLFAPQLENLKNVTLHVLPMHRAPHLNDIGNLSALIKLIRNIQPDILHAHSTKAGMLVRLARLFVKTKIIYTPHAFLTMNPNTSAFVKFCYGIYEKLLSPFMRRCIMLSCQEQEHARSLGIPASKLILGTCGVASLPPVDRKSIRKNWQVAENEIVVGFVGRLAHQKNPELAVEAFANAKKIFPYLKLIMVGEGELLHSAKARAQSLAVGTDIIWLGAQDARPLYTGFDILLITSRYENMAYTLIEALYAGLPTVTTEVGISDICIMEGQTGYVLPPDAEAMGHEIAKLAQDPTLRDAMRFAARAHAHRFSLANMYKSHWDIYHDA